MSRRRLQVVLNPSAGGGRGGHLGGEIERELRERGLMFDLVRTGAAGDAVELGYRAAIGGADIVVAVGGDGTIHEVAAGLLRALDEDPTRPAALGVVPVGTGNDFAKLIDARPGRRAAYDRLAVGERRRIDAGLARWDDREERFVNAFGTGIDTEVVRAIQSLRRLPRPLVYLLGVTRALIGYTAPGLRVSVGTERFEKRVMTLAVANGRCIGGSFWICPDARPDDGLLDLCMVEHLPLVRQPAMAVRILRGTHERRAEVTIRKAKHVVVATADGAPLDLQLDGEPRRAQRGRVELRVLPGALPVMVGPGSAVGSDRARDDSREDGA